MKREKFRSLKKLMREEARINLSKFLRNLGNYATEEQKQRFNISVDMAADKQESLIKRYAKDLLPLKRNKEMLECLVAKLPNFRITQTCKKAIAEQMKDGVMISNILNTWLLEMNRLSSRPSFSKEEAYQIVEFCCKMLEMAEAMYLWIDYTGWRLKNDLWEYWEESLTRFVEGDYNKFGILVSMGNADWYKMSYPVISCSYVTESFRSMYLLNSPEDYSRARKIGWYFRPSVNDVIGMDPTDAVTVCTQRTETFEQYKAIMLNKTFIDDEIWLWSNHPSFQSCYVPCDMTQTAQYNEVVLRGNTRPDGVIIFKSEYECQESVLSLRAEEIAQKRRLPLLIYDYHENRVRCDYRFC